MGARVLGRDREIAAFERALRDVRESGWGGVLLLEAPAGAGKTTLAEEFSRRAGAHGVATFWGRCWESGGAPPFWPWIRVLRDIVATPAGDAALCDLGRAAGYIRELIGDPQSPNPGEVTSQQARFALFDATVRLLTRVADSAPILVVLDDLHAADGGTLRLLQFAARELRAGPALLVGTYRPEEAKVAGDVLEILADVAREGSVMVLGGLELPALAATLENSLGFPVSARLLETLHGITDGNPFFAREIVRMLEVEGHVRLDTTSEVDVVLPPRVSQAILRRVEPLPASVRDLLERAAVVGREFDVAMVAATAGAPVGDVADLLSEAVRHDVVKPGAGARYGFCHAMLREAIYEVIPPLRRAELHAAVAGVLEQRGASRVEVSHHLRAGVATAGASRAFDATVAGVDEALRTFAFEDAVALADAALALAGEAGVDDRAGVEVLIRRGRAQARAGAIDDAPRSFLEAAQIARSASWAEGVAKAAIAYADAPVVGGVTDAQLVQLLEDARRLLPEEDSELRALVLARLAHAQIFVPDVDTRTALIDAALAMARRVASPSALAVVLEASLAVLLNARLDEGTLALADEAVELARSHGDAEREVMLRARRASWLLDLRGARAFNDEVDAVKRLAHDLRYPLARWTATVLSFTQSMIAGDLERCDALCREAADLQNPNSAGAAAMHQTTLRLLRGTLTQEDLDAARFIATVRPGLAFTWEAVACPIAAAIGRIDDAQALLDRLVDAAPAQPRDQRFPVTLAFLTEGAAILDDGPAARRLHHLLGELAGHQVFVAMVTPVAYFGPVELYSGIAARVMGDDAEAESQLRVAIRAAERLGAHGAVARGRVELARVLAGRGAREEARRQAADALQFAERAGLGLVAEAAPAVLADAPAAAAAPPREAGASLVREGEYWSIEFDGTVCRLRDTKALWYLALLLEQPNREFPAFELVAAVEGNSRGAEAENGAGGHPSLRWAALDARAKADYRRRLQDLAAEVDEAEALGDALGAERARSEIEFIARELTAAVGLGGRDRARGDVERARVAVTKLLKRLLQKLADADATLGAHLRATIRTGTFCGYMADVQPTFQWKVRR